MGKTKIIPLVFTFAFGILVGIEVSSLWTKAKNNILGESTVTYQEDKRQRKLVYQEISPDSKRKIMLYEMPFLGRGELDYRNYLSNQYLFAVETPFSGREYQVFINDYKTGYPHWLGNEHIFFTGGCGTGCQTLHLVDVNSKESRQGLLEFTPLQGNKTESKFYDWFGQKFKFQGVIQHIQSAFLDNQAFLIFQLDNPDEPSSEQKFLFTKTQLKAL